MNIAHDISAINKRIKASIMAIILLVINHLRYSVFTRLVTVYILRKYIGYINKNNKPNITELE